MKHIYLDKSFFIFLIIVIITGSFNNFILYFSLLLIHEAGHTIMGLILGYKLDQICFYPCGGVTNFIVCLNKPLKYELLVLLMGPIMQVIGYLFLNLFINNDNLIIYNYALLIFNLLPIYPLDGGKLLNIICNYKLNYLKSFYFTFIISVIGIMTLLIWNIFSFNFNLLMMTCMLIYKLRNSYKNLGHDYNKFLLERYLYNYQFNKKKYINSIKKFYRDYEHIVNFENEKQVLEKYFLRQICKTNRKIN